MSADEVGPGIAKCGRVGHAMLQALRFVRNNPGCSKYAVARELGAPFRDPAHSPGAMYATIDRCIHLGFIDATQPDGRVYSLFISAAGAERLDQT
jgi:hypothetical protein